MEHSYSERPVWKTTPSGCEILQQLLIDAFHLSFSIQLFGPRSSLVLSLISNLYNVAIEIQGQKLSYYTRDHVILQLEIHANSL